MNDMNSSAQGRCTCGDIVYRIRSRPLVVHCCHCTWCQRETGSAFVINGMIESDRVELLQGKPEMINTPSASGKGQKIVRCPRCKVAVWSHYPGGGDIITFIRMGTLENPNAFPPEVHVFTSTKQPWVVIPDGVPAFEEYYQASTVWSKESLERRETLRNRK